MSLYDTIEIGNKHNIIKKKLEGEDNVIYVTPYEDLFEKLYSTHIAVGHGTRDKMIFSLKAKCQIPRPVIQIFLECCQVCQKKKANRHANLVIKPIISKEFCSRAQVDLIDYQSCQDGQYKWLLNYQDHLTKFICLRPLKSKQAVEVAVELLKIFLEFGAPAILQSDNGREFVNSVITELVKLWPDLKVLHGRPRHPQSQGSIERSNQDVENMLRAWMMDKNSTNWSVGCYFVQYQKNSSHHRIIGRSPYRALFGTNPKVGLSSTNLPSEIITTLETEEDLNGVLSELHRKTDENVKVLNENMNEDIDGLEESNISNEILITNSIGMNVTLPLASSLESVSESQETVICLNCTSQKNASCVLCSLQASILSNRDECHSGQKKAGEKMVLSAAKKLPPLKIGDCVLLPVEKIDRGPSDMQNLICVIVAHKNGVFQLGSSVGKIKGWYNRADIVAADCQFLNVENVPDKYISVREAISGVSLRDGQGYFKCSCKPSKKQCQTNRCVCFKKKIKCNSRCHTSATCLNK